MTAGGVALVADGALPAAVVVQVAGAAGAHTVHFSMGELGAFHVHFDLLCRGMRQKEKVTPADTFSRQTTRVQNTGFSTFPPINPRDHLKASKQNVQGVSYFFSKICRYQKVGTQTF